ncbi:MAG: transporter substrate-binding domain-containing protein [Candidatus Symbiothrix sp.]|jgi:membrane-bound lytic murein transglycosylase MltF|nr:transporter substrate-binding domain-containing protein [Candidatus Symbiothrix sp.]
MKKQIGIICLAVVLIGSLSYILIRRHHQAPVVRDYEQIAADTLHVVTEYNLVDYYLSGDTIAGVQYELINFIEQRSGLPVSISLEQNLETCMEKLENETYDVIARSIPITNEHSERLAFTTPITRNKQVLVQRQQTDENDSLFIDNQIQLANRTVFVPENSPAILRLKNLSEEIAEQIHIGQISNYAAEQLIYMVSSGKIDYAVVDRELALKNLEQFSNINIDTDITFTQLQAWAVRKNAPILLDSLNVWITNYFSLPLHRKK